MSSSCPDRHADLRTAGAVAAVLAGTAAGAPAAAQQVYWQPRFEARIEGHTNRNLAIESEAEDEIAGYRADLGVTWGRITPRSETRIRPLLRFQDYPDRDGLQRFEQFLDLETLYRTLRSDFELVGRFSRRDAYTAEFIEAEFDEFDPNDPTVSETGRILADTTRTRFQVRPGYTYRFSERTGLAAGVTYERVDYDDPRFTAGQRDFDFVLAEGTWRWRSDPLTEIAFGPYVSRYETRDDSSRSDGYGAVLSWGREWSERLSSTFTGRVERTESDRLLGVPAVPVEESTTAWAASVDVRSRTEISQWRFVAGRRITPTGSGAKADSDELRVEYTRAHSERLSSITALRALRIRSQSELVGRFDDRDYARLELSLRWAVTPTWFIRGGYEFTWQEYQFETADATNNAIFLSVGFLGLGPQR